MLLCNRLLKLVLIRFKIILWQVMRIILMKLFNGRLVDIRFHAVILMLLMILRNGIRCLVRM